MVGEILVGVLFLVFIFFIKKIATRRRFNQHVYFTKIIEMKISNPQPWKMPFKTYNNSIFGEIKGIYKGRDIEISLSAKGIKTGIVSAYADPKIIPFKTPALQFVLDYPSITTNCRLYPMGLVGAVTFGTSEENKNLFEAQFVSLLDEVILALEIVESGKYTV